jgi:MFS family permease
MYQDRPSCRTVALVDRQRRVEDLGSVGILPPVRSLLARITETIAPTRLGRSFRWLLSAAVINNVGDGIALAAGPLLVASQTRDPLLVSMALLAEYLPVLLFGVLGGAAADRFDRKRMVVAVNLGRTGVLVVLGATIVSGNVNIAVVLVALFVLGTAETFADSASSTLRRLDRSRSSFLVLVATRDTRSAPSAKQAAFVANGSAMPAAKRKAPIGGVSSWFVSRKAPCIRAVAVPRSSRATRPGMVEGIR